jgi:predicted Zn-dependent protease
MKKNSSLFINRGRVLLYLSVAEVFALVLALSSCAYTGTFAKIGAAVGQATGVIDANTASAIVKSGEAFGRAYEDITPEQEYYIGRAVGANILTSYKLQTNIPGWTMYANKIANTLVINSKRPEIFNGYHVGILDSEEINAFATPGGHIFITRGLINCTSSEDTLAAVLAHEVAHIQLEHGLKAIKNSRFTQAVLVTGTSAASVAAGDYNLSELVNTFSDSINEIITTLVINGYSQKQEFEADLTALEIMANAGYTPSSLIDMLKVLEKNQPGKPGGFNKTHPSPKERIAGVEKEIGKYKDKVSDTRSSRQQRFSNVN